MNGTRSARALLFDDVGYGFGHTLGGTMRVLSSEENGSASALLVDVSRQRRSSGNLDGRLLSPFAQTMGGFRSSTPLDASGKSVFLSQVLPTSKNSSNELARIELLCGG